MPGDAKRFERLIGPPSEGEEPVAIVAAILAQLLNRDQSGWRGLGHAL
jgi:hypothetical protein